MQLPDRLKRAFAKFPAASVLLVVLVAGLAWEMLGGQETKAMRAISGRDAAGVYLGRLPAPVEPSLIDPIVDILNPRPRYRLMTIRHIAPIKRDGPMPHAYVGECKQCHLIIGGPPAGSQPKTPMGAMLENISISYGKVGPPLLPTSNRAHPAAGRCIKCHDIVVKVPVKKKRGLSWLN